MKSRVFFGVIASIFTIIFLGCFESNVYAELDSNDDYILTNNYRRQVQKVIV